jgi:hypothetical protein
LRELLPNFGSVENFHADNFPGDNVKDEHPFLGCQHYIPVTGTVGMGCEVGFTPQGLQAAGAGHACASL